MKHKHADVLIAIAEGKIVQWRNPEIGIWFDAGFKPYTPLTNDEFQWRIKPEPKPDVILYGHTGWLRIHGRKNQCEDDTCKFTFDGETGELKKAEVL